MGTATKRQVSMGRHSVHVWHWVLLQRYVTPYGSPNTEALFSRCGVRRTACASVIVPQAHSEAYGRGSLPLHDLVSDSANPQVSVRSATTATVGSS